jgi:hypothetical protein
MLEEARMTDRCRRLFTIAALCAAAGGVPAGGQTSAPAAADAPAPVNLDRALDKPLTFSVDRVPLADALAQLRKATQTNIVANWNALAQTGVTRETPVTLRLKDVTYETVVRTLVEILPATGSKPNYLVGDNALDLTTNAALGKGAATRLYPLDRVMAYSLQGGAGGGDAKTIEAVLRAELARAGEPMDAAGHALAMRNGTLAATVSDRGQTVLLRAVGLLSTPIRPGQLPAGLAVTATGKRAQEALAKAAGGLSPPGLAVALAQDPEKFPGVSVAFLPGTAEELAKAAPALGVTVTDGGVALVGPTAALDARTVLAVFDLRDVIRRQAAKSPQKPPPGAGELQETVVKTVQTRVSAGTAGGAGGGWGGMNDLGKAAAVMVPYNGILIVFAPADTQRQVSVVLQELLVR